MVTIALFGPAEDQEIQSLSKRLRHRGAQAWVIDLGAFPARLRLTLDNGKISVDGRPLSDIGAAYLRKIGSDLPSLLGYQQPAAQIPVAEWDAQYSSAVTALDNNLASHMLRQAIVEDLSQHCVVINPPRLQNLHRLKTFLLQQLKAAQIPVPEFIIGSAAEPLAAFAQRATQKWAGSVCKPLAGIYKTHRYSAAQFREHPWSERPACYQRLIEGETVRCYLLNGRLLSAARILHGPEVDSSISQTGIEVCQLADPARAAAEMAAQALGLAFCGLDLMIEGGTQAPLVIDCNLSPMFVNYSRLSRCDIAGLLADHLIACAQGQVGGDQRPQVWEMVDQAKDLLAHDPDLADLLIATKAPKRGR